MLRWRYGVPVGGCELEVVQLHDLSLLHIAVEEVRLAKRTAIHIDQFGASSG